MHDRILFLFREQADTLSWKSEHAALCMLVHLQAIKLCGMIQESIKENFAKDPTVQTIL